MKRRVINTFGFIFLMIVCLQSYSQEMELKLIQDIEKKLSKLDSIPLNWFDRYLKTYPANDFLLGMKYYNISYNYNNKDAKRELIKEVNNNDNLKSGTFINLALGAIEANDGNIVNAKKYYDKSYLLDSNKNNKWIRIELYYYYLQNNFNDGKEIDYLLEAIEIDSDFELALIELSNHYILEGNNSLAEKVLNNNNFDLYAFKKQFLLGNIQLEKNNISEAKKYFKSSISIKENSDSYIGLGYINQFFENDYSAAKLNYECAITIDKEDPMAYKRLGVLELDLNNYELADSLLSKAIEIDSDPDTYRELIHANILINNYEKARSLNEDYVTLFGMDHYSDFWKILILLLDEKNKELAQSLLNEFYNSYDEKERVWLKAQLSEWGVDLH